MLLFPNLLSEVTRPMPNAVGTSHDVQYKEKNMLHDDTNIIVQCRSIQFFSL